MSIVYCCRNDAGVRLNTLSKIFYSLYISGFNSKTENKNKITVDAYFRISEGDVDAVKSAKAPPLQLIKYCPIQCGSSVAVLLSVLMSVLVTFHPMYVRNHII